MVHVCCFCCLISLTIYVIVVLTTNTENTIKLVDSSGKVQDIPHSKLFSTLGIGWAAFGLSLIFNILYYALHPSQVTHSIVHIILNIFLQVDLLNIREKLVVALVGYEINLVTFTKKGLDLKLKFLEN